MMPWKRLFEITISQRNNIVLIKSNKLFQINGNVKKKLYTMAAMHSA